MKVVLAVYVLGEAGLFFVVLVTVVFVVAVELVVYHGFHDVCQVSLNIGSLGKPY